MDLTMTIHINISCFLYIFILAHFLDYNLLNPVKNS